MQLLIKLFRFQLYFCIGKVYCLNRDDWARQAFTVAWLGKKHRIFNIDFCKVSKNE